MPLVRIACRQGKPPPSSRAVGDAVHRAMVEAVQVPAADRFQIITEHSAGDLVYDPAYLNVTRSDDIILIQITLNADRSLDLKKALYKCIAEVLHGELGVRI